MTTLTLRRGSTLRWRGQITTDSLGGYALTACAVWMGGRADLDVRALDDAPGWVEVSADAAETAGWPLRLAEMTVRADGLTGEAFETETTFIDIQAEVTA